MTENLDPIGIAVIGAGRMGQYHMNLIAENPKTRLLGIVDLPGQADGIAQQHDVPGFSSIDQMLQTVNPEGVIVATPTEFHLQPVIAVLNQNIDVLLEKPIAANLDEAQEMIDKCKDSRGQILVGHHRRYNPVATTVKNMIDEGVIGQLLGVSGQWCVRKPVDYFDSPWRKNWQASPVFTNLIHDVDMLRYLCGEIESVYADSSNGFRNSNLEDTVAVNLRFQSGALGTFLLSDAAPSPWTWEQGTGESRAFPFSGENSMRFMGSKGAIEFPCLKLWRYENDNTGNWGDVPVSSNIEVPTGDAFQLQLNHFCEVIRQKKRPVVSATDGFQSLQVILKILESTKNGTAQKLQN